ncbi:SGNH/GDSL hydrolase family protein [Botryobacter ruber]|uniref:SGNH/GDSL hydrolase family protein n=1 Tax=Botryobacter ruber TaxID=2171629 RepID=UPI000E0A977C|nr:SGNH/GDSL hydrolase family protein [Botryobacter ruber]
MTTPTAANQPAHQYTYLALGDSYTIGEGVPENDQWGMQLARLLRGQGLAVADPVTIARTGWTTGELANAVAAANLSGQFDLVSLLIGVNNQYRGLSLENYREEFSNLLQTAIQFAGNQPAHVLVLSVPDWGVTPFAQDRDRPRIAAEIDAFNAVAKAETEKAGAAFIYITPLTRKAAAEPVYLADDGLHYSGKMHLEWAKLALPVAKQLLQ